LPLALYLVTCIMDIPSVEILMIVAWK